MNGVDADKTAPLPIKPDYSLPRANRLNPSGYRGTFNDGVSVVSRFFVMYYTKGNTDSQVGTVTSKKTFPHAVQRNRARRLLRAAYRFTKSEIEPGVRMVLIGRRKILDVKSDAVADELRRFYRKTGIAKRTGQ